MAHTNTDITKGPNGVRASAEKRQARLRKAQEIADEGGSLKHVAKAYGISRPGARQFLRVFASPELLKQLNDNSSPGVQLTPEEVQRRIDALRAHNTFTAAAKSLGHNRHALWQWVSRATGMPAKLGIAQLLEDYAEPDEELVDA